MELGGPIKNRKGPLLPVLNLAVKAGDRSVWIRICKSSSRRKLRVFAETKLALRCRDQRLQLEMLRSRFKEWNSCFVLNARNTTKDSCKNSKRLWLEMFNVCRTFEAVKHTLAYTGRQFVLPWQTMIEGCVKECAT